jgi:acetyltransferase
MAHPNPESTPRLPAWRYPTSLIDAWRTPAGEQFVLRPILPQDGGLLEDFYASLSPRSRRLRFHGGVNALSPDSLSRLSCVDHDRHLALVVSVVTEGAEVIVAEARYVVDETGRGGEFAIAVSDVWQRRGIASRAIAALCRAARLQGLDWLWGDILNDNAAMLGLMDHCGFCRSTLAEDGKVRVERRVASDLAAAPRRRRRPLALLAQWMFSGRLYA